MPDKSRGATVPIAAFIVAAVVLYACGGGGGTGGTVTAGGATGGTTSSSGGTATGGLTTTTGTTGGPNVQVTVDPANTSCLTDAQVLFTAHVFGSTNTEVVWSVEGTNRGTIDQSGLYIAPTNPTTAFVRATSVANPDKYGRAGIVVKERAKIVYFGSESAYDGEPYARVNDLSDDGSTAVGAKLVGSGWVPAYWTKLSGWVLLPLPPGATEGEVLATAGNGNWMVGVADGGAVRFNKLGLVEYIRDTDGNIVTAAPSDCTQLGDIIVGTSWKWHYIFGYRTIPLNAVDALSLNGVVVGGSKNVLVNGVMRQRAHTWTDNGGLVDLNIGDDSIVMNLNAFGNTASGRVFVSGNEAQFYKVGSPLINFSSEHRSMSGNGAWTTGVDNNGAYRWSNSTGKIPIKTLLLDNGLLADIEALLFDGVVFVSDSGRHFVGEAGMSPLGQRKYFYATLP